MIRLFAVIKLVFGFGLLIYFSKAGFDSTALGLALCLMGATPYLIKIAFNDKGYPDEKKKPN